MKRLVKNPFTTFILKCLLLRACKQNMMQQQAFIEAFDQLSQRAPRQKEVLLGLLKGKSDEEIADALSKHPGTVRKQISDICELFGLKTSRGISKRSALVALFAKYKPELIDDRPQKERVPYDTSEGNLALCNRKSLLDLGTAPDTSAFYGRMEELKNLERSIVKEQCRLIAVWGMGGLGKTTLSVQLAHRLQDQFDYIIWRSLRETPKLEATITDLLKVLSNNKKTDSKSSLEEKIKLLINLLTSSRCLLILDNFESVIPDGEGVEDSQEDYKKYSYLLKRVSETSHKSCLLLTSRTKPEEIAISEGKTLPVRSLPLKGLLDSEAVKILDQKELSGLDNEKHQLVELYEGNPLALKIVATCIQDLFNGNVSEFIKQDFVKFVGIESLLNEQFEILSPLEKNLLYWLAINRESISIAELYQDILNKTTNSDLVASLGKLKRKALIESVDGGFTLQNVVLEYMTNILIKNFSEDLNSGKFEFSNTYPLIKATAKDYIRNNQTQLILKPVTDQILDFETTVINPLKEKKSSVRRKGYAVGNLLNLLTHAKFPLCDLDLSDLTIWQAYLRGEGLQGVKFNNSDLNYSRFTEAFGTVLSVASSPTEGILAMGDTKSTIRLCTIDGQQLSTFEGHTNWVRSVDFSPDGQTLASASDDQTIKLWNRKTCQCLKTFEGHRERVWSVVFSPDGKTLASGSEDNTVKLWNVEEGQHLKTLKEHEGWIRCVAFSPDGQILASSSSDQTIKLWDLKTGSCVKTLEAHKGRVCSISFSPNGQILASGGDDKTVRLWDLETGSCVKTLEGHEQGLRHVAFSPDGQILVSGGEDCTTRVWNVNTGKLLKILTGHRERIWMLCFCLTHKNRLISSSDDKTVKFWDVDTGQCLKTLQGYTNWAWSIVFTPDNKKLVTSNEDRTIKLWDVETGKCLKTLKGHDNRIRSIDISPDGKTLASGSDDQKITIWDFQIGQRTRVLEGHDDRVLAVSFHPTEKDFLASGGDDRIVRIWNVYTGQCIKQLEGHQSWIWSIAFHPEGQILASSSEDQTIKLWNIETGLCLNTLEGHEGWVRSVAFSPDGQTLASGSEDKTVKLWNIDTGECIQTLRSNSAIRSIAFHPNGKSIAAAGEDSTVTIWNVPKGKISHVSKYHQERIWAISFDSDGNTLASSSEEGVTYLEKFFDKTCTILQPPRLCENADITGATGLTAAQIQALKVLGARKTD